MHLHAFYSCSNNDTDRSKAAGAVGDQGPREQHPSPRFLVIAGLAFLHLQETVGEESVFRDNLV